jgi:5-deoxy-D-glucuronate isomerase
MMDCGKVKQLKPFLVQQMVREQNKDEPFSGQRERYMRKPIQDEFTKLSISRQRKYQLRMQRDKRCTECGAPAAQGSRCLKHLVKARERQRKKRGLKRRYYNTLSYKLQAVA